MHSPLCGKEQRISTWRFLNEIMEEGGEKGIIRAIGVSNFGVNHLRQLEEAGLPAPAVNQIEPKASSLSRLRENIDIFDFALTPEEIQRIDMEMDLTKDNEYKGKRIALEWNPVNCD
ncbi:hypothetical protein QFC24_000793 [Naganishia onofrii]|uniref:Uncharacterized protein n=1 Tax=Naganishia onofrii TaxID=1851511 RepID=A0ACC2XUR4_9TREE|nr:hypothetical protein QFC24_000793 [Naganishia onofrii]